MFLSACLMSSDPRCNLPILGPVYLRACHDHRSDILPHTEALGSGGDLGEGCLGTFPPQCLMQECKQ